MNEIIIIIIIIIMLKILIVCNLSSLNWTNLISITLSAVIFGRIG